MNRQRSVFGAVVMFLFAFGAVAAWYWAGHPEGIHRGPQLQEAVALASWIGFVASMMGVLFGLDVEKM